MTYEKLTELLASHGVKPGIGGKGTYKRLAENLPDEMIIELAAEGLDENSKRKAPVIITPDTVYFARPSNIFGGLDISTAKRSDINAVDVSGMLQATLTIATSGGRFHVIMNKKKAQEVARALRG